MGKYLIPIGIVVLLLITGLSLFSSKQREIATNLDLPTPSHLAIDGTFEGITVCSKVSRPLPQIPSDTECEMAIWRVTFSPDFTYSLTASYGMSQPGTLGIKGGSKINMEGNWTITEGANTNPKAVVLQLNTDNPGVSAFFLKVNDNLIHLLDSNKNMMIGNGAWAYTLNKTSGIQTNETTLPSTSADSAIVGIFEGRTICKDFLVEFSQQPTGDCDKIKWKLTLNPNRYHLLTSRGSSEGTWTVEGNIYQLKSDKTQQAVSLLRIDDNHLFFLDQNTHLLVGNDLWSYTLSRTN